MIGFLTGLDKTFLVGTRDHTVQTFCPETPMFDSLYIAFQNPRSSSITYTTFRFRSVYIPRHFVLSNVNRSSSCPNDACVHGYRAYATGYCLMTMVGCNQKYGRDSRKATLDTMVQITAVSVVVRTFLGTLSAAN